MKRYKTFGVTYIKNSYFLILTCRKKPWLVQPRFFTLFIVYTIMLADFFTQSMSILLSNIEFMLGIGTFL